MRDHALILVRAIRIVTEANVLNHRVDFNGVDTVDPEPKRMIDIISRAGSDDQNISEWSSTAVLLKQMNQRIFRSPNGKGHHPLMADGVHRNSTVGIPHYLVVGRPMSFGVSAASRRGNGGQDYQERQPSRSREVSGLIEQVGDAGTADSEPNWRRRLKK